MCHLASNSIVQLLFAVLALSASLALLIYLPVATQAGIGEFGFQYRGAEVSPLHAVAVLLSTCLGVFCALYLERSLRIEHVGQPRKIREYLQFINAGSVLVAVCIFVFIFDRVYLEVGDLAAYFSAFQSGFVFRQVLRALLKV